MLDGILGPGEKPVRIALAAERGAPRPSRLRVIGFDENPLPAILEHAQRLARQGLCDLLAVRRRTGPQRRELACERMFA